MDKIKEIAARNQQRAREIIADTKLVEIWQSAGAEINLVGSLSMGLLVKHRDIDFHIYSAPLKIADSFAAMARLAENPRIKHIEFGNLLDTPEVCVEWHAQYLDADNEMWQLDLIHIVKGSRYDGYFERMASRICAVLTDETRDAIMRLKFETPDTEKIMGVEYYRAVIQGGVRTWPELAAWRQANPVTGVVEWIP